MQGARRRLKHDLGSLRTGRASPNLLDPIQVDAYGSAMPLNQVATVNVPEPRLLSVQVWDRSMVAAGREGDPRLRSRPQPADRRPGRSACASPS